MATSPNQWKFFEWDVKPQTNKQTNKQNIALRDIFRLHFGDSNYVTWSTVSCSVDFWLVEILLSAFAKFSCKVSMSFFSVWTFLTIVILINVSWFRSCRKTSTFFEFASIRFALVSIFRNLVCKDAKSRRLNLCHKQQLAN